MSAGELRRPLRPETPIAIGRPSEKARSGSWQEEQEMEPPELECFGCYRVVLRDWEVKIQSQRNGEGRGQQE